MCSVPSTATLRQPNWSCVNLRKFIPSLATATRVDSLTWQPTHGSTTLTMIQKLMKNTTNRSCYVVWTDDVGVVLDADKLCVAILTPLVWIIIVTQQPNLPRLRPVTSLVPQQPRQHPLLQQLLLDLFISKQMIIQEKVIIRWYVRIV